MAHRYHPLVRSTRPVAGYIMPFPHPAQNCIPVPLPGPRFHSITVKRTKHNKPNQKTRAGLVHSPMSTPEVNPTNGGGSGKDRNDTLDDTEPCYTWARNKKRRNVNEVPTLPFSLSHLPASILLYIRPNLSGRCLRSAVPLSACGVVS